MFKEFEKETKIKLHYVPVRNLSLESEKVENNIWGNLLTMSTKVYLFLK